MSESDPAGFLSRWSRRKAQAKSAQPDAAETGPQAREPAWPAEPVAGAAAPAPRNDLDAAPAPETDAAHSGAATAAEPGTTDEALPTLADVQDLTPESDFRPFMRRAVAPDVKNAAMKKLFADPHFNVMDGLDIYIDDYTRRETMPPAMLAKVAGARILNLLQDDEPCADTREVAPAASATAPSVQAADMPFADAGPSEREANTDGEPRPEEENGPDGEVAVRQAPEA